MEIARELDDLERRDDGRNDRDRLHRLFEVSWHHDLSTTPEAATVNGVRGFDDRWSDLRPEATEAKEATRRRLRGLLDTFDPAALDVVDRVSHGLLHRDLSEAIEEAAFRPELQPVNQLWGVQQDAAAILEAQPAETPDDHELIVARLRALPELVDQTIENLRRGLAAGLTPPRICLRDVPDQIVNQLAADPHDSPLLVPLAGAGDEARAAAAAAFRDGIAPALERLRTFLVDTYIPGARESTACRDLPDGEAYYDHLVRRHTTTNLSPREIHDTGLAEVARIRAEMAVVAERAGFDGFDAYAHHLRTDPQHQHTTAEALIEGYREIGRRVDAHLPALFGRLPRQPYDVVPVPSYAEKSQTAAYYLPPAPDGSRPGQFFANTYDLPSRYIWEMEALTLHEAVPGHHLQIAIAQELDELPDFRRNAWYTAYGEGWALYAESLGPDVGCYTDPASHFGALTGEIWRAVRLVLDTGLHALGWTREQAIAYFQDATGRDDHDIVVEVDRYIVWPGQALGYKIGELKIKELRAQASATLGPRFDLRAFHDEVLAHGCLPLDLLERVVADWTSAAAG